MASHVSEINEYLVGFRDSFPDFPPLIISLRRVTHEAHKLSLRLRVYEISKVIDSTFSSKA